MFCSRTSGQRIFSEPCISWGGASSYVR
jgi:hypothetical protein